MNRENIIKLAREAGWQYADDDRGYEPLWRFAALVADAEREACAELIPPQYFELRDAIRARGETK